MKHLFQYGLLILLFVACDSHRPDGWYHLSENGTPLSRPIVVVNDFEAVRLDSTASGDGGMIYYIAGSLTEDKRPFFYDATCKAIGKQIAFVFEDSVVCAPRVNQGIESGNFGIGLNDADLAYRIWESLERQLSPSRLEIER